MKSQKESINELLSENRYILIILDACRYDYLKELVAATEPRQSPANNTIDWFKAIFPGWYDLCYVTNQAVTSNNKFAWFSDDHFAETIKAWKWGKMEAVTRSAIENLKDRMVIHYTATHSPYGSTGISMRDAQEAIREGRITADEIKEAYMEDLKRVWSECEKIISRARQRVVVTADHGELLGEEGVYGHGEPAAKAGLHSKLYEVPWLDISPEEEMIEERLRELGYLK